MTLSDRIITAGPDEAREVMDALWESLPPLPDCDLEVLICPTCERFTAMLDAEAYLIAAMMLVPEGWVVSLSSIISPGWHGFIATPETIAPYREASARAPTAWQALAAAIAKTCETNLTEGN